MRILNYGSLNYDFTYQVDHMVRPGETLASRQLEIHCGGKGLNQSIALARAGIEVYHAGMTGEDGGLLLEECAGNGIDTGLVRTLKGKSGHAIIQVDPHGENSILLCEGANGANSPEQLEEVFAAFGTGDWILLQNEINLLDQIIERAFEKGLKIVLNPSPYNEKIGSCRLEYVSVFLLNETEGEQISGEKEPRRILQKMHGMYPNSQIILTLGKKGVFYFDGGEEIFVPAFTVEAVDTTAAGDTFTGYYLAAALRGRPVREALRMGCAASALAVTRRGAAESIPGRVEVEAFLAGEFPTTAYKRR